LKIVGKGLLFPFCYLAANARREGRRPPSLNPAKAAAWQERAKIPLIVIVTGPKDN
jgi:hypothetical protein